MVCRKNVDVHEDAEGERELLTRILSGEMHVHA